MLREKLTNDIREKCSAKAGVLGQLGLRHTNPALTKALRGLLGTGLLAGASYAGLKNLDNYNIVGSTLPTLSFPGAPEGTVLKPGSIPEPESISEPESKIELTDEDRAMGAFVNKLRGHRFATDPVGTISGALKEKAMPYVKTYDELFDKASELDPWDPMHMSGLFYDVYFGDRAKYNENYPKPPALQLLAPGIRINRGIDEGMPSGTYAELLKDDGRLIPPGSEDEETVYTGRAIPNITLANHVRYGWSPSEKAKSLRHRRIINVIDSSDPVRALAALAHELGESYHMQPKRPYAFTKRDTVGHGGPSAILNELYARNAFTKEELKHDDLPDIRRSTGEMDIINQALDETGRFPLPYEYIRDGALNKTHPTAEHRKKLYMAIKRLYEERLI